MCIICLKCRIIILIVIIINLGQMSLHMYRILPTTTYGLRNNSCTKLSRPCMEAQWFDGRLSDSRSREPGHELLAPLTATRCGGVTP